MMAALQQSDIADALAQLNKLSSEELKELCNGTSDDKFDELVNKADKIKSLESEREMLMASVRSLAEFNLSKQSDYESDRSKLINLVGESNKLKDDIEDKAMKLSELSKKTSLDSTLSVLNSATKQADDDSESVAKAYLDNNLEHFEFISQYLDKRKLAYVRRIKADKLRQETKESWSR